ncbi:MAG: AAA family ATPase [Candidatus Acidiferrales bacterium]
MVAGLLPARSNGILVGDSGLGKSPLLYTLALCVAAGLPFMDLPTTRGDVLILDYENSGGDSEELLERIRQHLGLDAVPNNLTIWNANDCAPRFGTLGYEARNVIQEWASATESSVKLVIIDPLSGFNAGAEEKNRDATEMLLGLRRINRELGTTHVLSHHRRKPSREPNGNVNLADCSNMRAWFSEARGAGALINGFDERLGVDLPGNVTQLAEITGEIREEVALVLRGFGRVRGEIGPFYLARVYDEDGVAVGYRKLCSAELLFNREQQEALARLGNRFRTGEARTIYRHGDQATSNWLNKCVRLGLVRKVGRGQWEKVLNGGGNGER